MPAFATFYARHLERALGRGICREYRPEEARLAGVRGRVDLAAQQRFAGLSFPVECRYDEYSADTQLNRVLRAALWRLNRLPGVTPTTRQALLSLDRRLEEAQPVQPGDLRGAVNFTRLNEHCRGAEHLARLVLDGASLVDSSGMSGAGVFLIDMNKLFERFVEHRLRRLLADRLIVNGQWPDHLDDDHQVRIRPDLVFERPGGGPVYVGDSKYKLTSDGFAREADYYQLLAYCTALGLSEGILVYCQHDGKAPPREVTTRSIGTRLRTFPLRLSGTVAEVELQVLELAGFIVSRCPRTVNSGAETDGGQWGSAHGSVNGDSTANSSPSEVKCR